MIEYAYIGVLSGLYTYTALVWGIYCVRRTRLRRVQPSKLNLILWTPINFILWPISMLVAHYKFHKNETNYREDEDI